MDKFTLLKEPLLDHRLYSSEYLDFTRDYYDAEIYFLNFNKGVLPLASYKQNGLLTIGTLPKTDAPISKEELSGFDSREVVAFLKEHFPDHQVINLRIFSLDNVPALSFRGFSSSPIYHAVAQVDQKDLLGYFDKKTRNQVRQSLNQNFQLTTDVPLETVYDLYLDNMRHHGTLPREIHYFQSLKDKLGSKVVFLSACDGSKLCGTNIFYLNKDYLLLLHNFSDHNYWSARVNNFLYLKMIEYGQSKGVKYFDYGPSTQKDISHLNFKIGFGGELVPVFELIWYRHWIDRLSAKAKHHYRNLLMRIRKNIQR